MGSNGEYKIRVKKDNGDIEFGFNKFSDAISFFTTCADTVDGMEEGKAVISIFFDKKED